MSVDLRTTYLGLELRSPLIASSSPLTRRPASLAEIEAAGAGAVVLPSLFEEQIEAEARHVDLLLDHGSDIFGEASSFFPQQVVRATTVDDHLAMVRAAVESLSIPVVASLNGATPGGWTTYAGVLEATGVAALELNLYRVAADPDHSAADVEDALVEVVREVRAEVAVPLAVKLGPFFSSLPHLARRLVDAGADGLVLFNRFYQPDLDLETMRAVPHLVLSTSDDLRLALRWIGLLHGRVDASLALTGGAHTGVDAVKAVLVGADAVMTTAALLQHGPGHLDRMRRDLLLWLAEHGFSSVEQARGSAAWSTGPDPDGFERANYLDVLAAGERWV